MAIHTIHRETRKCDRGATKTRAVTEVPAVEKHRPACRNHPSSHTQNRATSGILKARVPRARCHTQSDCDGRIAPLQSSGTPSQAQASEAAWLSGSNSMPHRPHPVQSTIWDNDRAVQNFQCPSAMRNARKRLLALACAMLYFAAIRCAIVGRSCDPSDSPGRHPTADVTLGRPPYATSNFAAMREWRTTPRSETVLPCRQLRTLEPG